jgi:hypothetical protein
MLFIAFQGPSPAEGKRSLSLKDFRSNAVASLQMRQIDDN